MAICDKTFQLYNCEPYTEDIIAVEPLEPISLEEASPFDCKRTSFRHPRETKGSDYTVTEASSTSCCEPENGCC